MTMKKEQSSRVKILKSIFNYFLFSVSLILFSLFFTACGNPLLDNIFHSRLVTFNSNGGSSVKSQTVYKGDKIVKPANPVKPANEFVGWYKDSDLFFEWSFDTIPESDLTLYAKWDDSGIDVFAAEPSIVKIVGYDPLDDDAFVVTVSNTSAIANTGELAIELSGDDEDCFTLSANLINNINPSGNFEFNVVPNAGLPIGTYTTDVTIKGNVTDINDKISKSITLNFRVVKDVTDVVIVSPPVKMNYISGEPLDLSGLVINVSYSDGTTDNNLPHSLFTSDRFFTTTPENGDNVSVIENNGRPVNIYWVDRRITNIGNLTVNPAPIFSAAVSVTSPVSGKAPSYTANTESGSNFTVHSVTWSPDDSVFIFEKIYKVSVTLTVVNGNYTFSGSLTNAKINGETAVVSNNIGTAVTLSYEMEATRANVSSISIKTYPAKIIYTHGETLSLAGLEISLHFDDGTVVDVAYNNFASYGESTESITVNISNGIRLSHSNDNGTLITITYSNTYPSLTESVTHFYLTVNKKPININNVTASNQPYNGTTTVTLSGGALVGVVQDDNVSFTLGNGTMYDADAGINKPVSTNIILTGGHAENYILIQPNVTVNITRIALTIRGINHTKVYDGSSIFNVTDPHEVFLNGILYDDYVYVTITNANYTGVNAGTQSINISSAYLGGLAAGNYNIVTPVTVDTGYFDANNFIKGRGIMKASGAYVNTPEFYSIGKTSNGEATININTVSPPTTLQSVEYKIGTNPVPPPDDDKIGWVTGTTFSMCNGKILSNQTYYIYARSRENNNYTTGTSNVSYPITLCRVSFNYNIWGLPLFSELVLQGETIPNITIPNEMGSFKGWFTTSDVPWNVNDLVTDDITLIAKWN